MTTFRGVRGELRWAYHEAGIVRDWVITGDGRQRTLTGRVEAVNAFRVSQRPLVFVVPRRRPWRWPIDTLQMTDGTLTARLGPMEQ